MQVDTGSHLPDPDPAPGRRIGIIAARFNSDVTEEMLAGCQATLEEFGVEADAVTIPADSQRATISIRLAEKIGPFNAPATLRATTLGTEDPHVAESPVELVP